MKFERLQASISNNADQQPSLYMALCMVESLFEDIEASAGELCQCPVGSELLPAKLVWLSRNIQEIYAEKNAELQRGRARLDAVMAKQSVAQQELETLAQAARQLEVQHSRLEGLEARLEEARAAAQKAQALERQCAQAQEQLTQLQAFDPVAARQKLTALEAELAEQEQEKRSLSTQLEQSSQKCALLQRSIQELTAQKNGVLEQAETLARTLIQGRGTLEAAERELQQDQTRLADLQKKQEDLTAERQHAQSAAAQLRSRLDRFQEEELAPLQAALQGVRQELEALEQDKQALTQEHSRAKETRGQLILEIARQKGENETQQEKLTLSQQSLAAAKQEQQLLLQSLAGSVGALEKLQEEVRQLTEKTLPDVRALQEKESLRKQNLLEAEAAARKELETCRAEAQALERKLPELEEDVRKDRVVYDALTAKYTANSRELENLKQQIAELSSNRAEEKREVYRKQLEEKQRQLGLVQQECVRLELETQEQEKKLMEGQNRRAELQKRKQQHDSALETTKKQLQELEFASSEKYIREASRLEEQARLLESTRGKLVSSLAGIQKILGKTPVEGPAALEDAFGQSLRQLRQHIDDLRRALLECARSLKLEER